ncbi:hypothetical protein GBA52_025097 [Prunus armeniaca]|nr:hypothetical protein GBA52_024345 [Prunus armeniaca]KAH0972941.1 hypothetical protein GBA52_025097 [Prunus armeniaca]
MQNKSLTKYGATPGSKQPELPQSRLGPQQPQCLANYSKSTQNKTSMVLMSLPKPTPKVLPRTVHIDLDPTQHGRMPCHFGINSGDDAKRGEIPHKAKIGHKEGGREGNREVESLKQD